MHTHFMNCYGTYLKEHYSDLNNMTCKELHEAKEIAETMKAIFDADTQYNIIKQMEEHNSNEGVEMTWNEFKTRFTTMYKSATPSEQSTMKAQLMSML